MRLEVGATAPVFKTKAIDGQTVDLAALRGQTVLLKFYRFATCPVCNWHMHGFIKDYPMLETLGIKTVVLYHSPGQKIEQTRRSLAPFDIIGDPERRIFNTYGVEKRLSGMFFPAVMRDYMRALRIGLPPGLLTSDGGITGNPADFLIDANGRIAFAHYGRHYADSLDATQAGELVRGLGVGVPTIGNNVSKLQAASATR